MKYAKQIGRFSSLMLLVWVGVYFIVRDGNILPVQAAVYQFVQASVDLESSTPEASANWTLNLTTVQEIPPSGKLSLTPQSGKFTIPAALAYTDIDLVISSVDQGLAPTAGTTAGSAWGVTIISGLNGSIVLQNNSVDSVTVDSEVVIRIGDHASYEFTGSEKIQNPFKVADVGTADIITIDAQSLDSGDNLIDTITLVTPIIESVDNTASQSPDIEMLIEGLTPPVDGSVEATAIGWGQVVPAASKTASLRVKVNTNAQAGYYIYIKQNQDMTNTEDQTTVINASPGSNLFPIDWQAPEGNSVGIGTAYLGYTTSDDSLDTVGAGGDRFTAGTKYAGLSTDDAVVLYHGEATQGDVEGQDFAIVTFQLEANNLHPSGNYRNTIEFTAKAIF